MLHNKHIKTFIVHTMNQDLKYNNLGQENQSKGQHKNIQFIEIKSQQETVKPSWHEITREEKVETNKKGSNNNARLPEHNRN